MHFCVFYRTTDATNKLYLYWEENHLKKNRKTDNGDFIYKYGLITLVFEAVHLHMMKADFSPEVLLLKHLDAWAGRAHSSW